MIAIYAGVVAMALLAAGYVAYGARRRGRGETDRHRANVGVFADRRRELAAEGEVQGLSEADVAHLEHELFASLHDEVPREATERNAADAAPRMRLVVAWALVATTVSVALYALWGEPHAPLLARAAEVMQDPRPPAGSLEALERALAEREDPGSLFHLGHLKIRMRDYEGAARVFEGLRARMPDAEVDAAWAQARYLADGGRLGPETRAAIERVRAAEPDHVLVLELLAMDAMQRDAFAEASGYLGRLLQRTPAGPRRALFGEALALAHERMAMDGAEDAPPAPERGATDGDAATTAGVVVAVSMSPDIDAEAGAPVFIVARAPSGGGPPHAVRRLTVGDLPARVELNDGHAMLPGRTLSALDAFEVIARIGLSGSPTRAPGDLESAPMTVRRGTEAVALEIGLRVP